MYQHSLFPVGGHSLDDCSQDLSQQGVHCIRLHRRKQRPVRQTNTAETNEGKYIKLTAEIISRSCVIVLESIFRLSDCCWLSWFGKSNIDSVYV